MKKSFKKDNPAEQFISAPREESGMLVDIAQINRAEPFISMFPIHEDVYQSIKTSISENGFDESQPLIVWREKNILLDGHTRMKACEELELKRLPVSYKSFVSEEEAVEYMYHLQFSRRNITDSELVPLAVRALEGYEKKYGEGSKAEFLVGRFKGLSLTKAKELSVVLDKAPELITSVIEGKQTLHSLYLKARSEKAKKDKHSLKQKVDVDFLPFKPELFINEGNIYYSSEQGKAKTIAISVAPSFHNAEMLEEILAVVKKYTEGNSEQTA